MRCSSTVTLLQITQTAAATTNKPNAANKTFLPNPVIPLFFFVYASLRIAGFYEDFYHEYSFLDRKILQFELEKKQAAQSRLFFYKGIVGRSPCRSIFALLFIPRHERLDVLDGFEDVGGEVDRLFLGDDDVVLDADADALLLQCTDPARQ